jgi:LemA protein
MSYNARRESFPDILLAGVYGFQEAVYWLIEDSTERETPQVDF